MWQALKRLLGLNDNDREIAKTPRDAPADMSPAERQPSARRPAAPVRESSAPGSAPAEPKLSLEGSDADGAESSEGGFDPYNTGAFNRSSSWDKISKHRDR